MFIYTSTIFRLSWDPPCYSRCRQTLVRIFLAHRLWLDRVLRLLRGGGQDHEGQDNGRSGALVPRHGGDRPETETEAQHRGRAYFYRGTRISTAGEVARSTFGSSEEKEEGEKYFLRISAPIF